MLYKIPLLPLPEIKEAHELERNTVWNTADKLNIFIFIVEGSCIFSLNSKEYLMKKGDYIIIPANQEYSRSPVQNAPCKMIYVHFITKEPIEKFDKEELTVLMQEAYLAGNEGFLNYNLSSAQTSSVILKNKSNSAEHYDIVYKMLQKIISERFNFRYLSPLFSSIKMAELLTTLSQDTVWENAWADEQDNPHYPEALNRAIIFIKKNITKKISVEQLAENCSISPQHLRRLFCKHLGTSPIKYINHLKISLAVDMLRTSDSSIKEIAYDLGFDNPHYFSRLFSKEESSSPSEKRSFIRSFEKNIE